MDISSVQHQLLHLVAVSVLGHALQIPGLLMHLWFIRNGVWNTYSFLVASEWKREKNTGLQSNVSEPWFGKWKMLLVIWQSKTS